MKCSRRFYLKLLGGPLVVLLLGSVLAGMTASVDTFHGFDLTVLAFYWSVAGVYVLLNYWSNRRRR
jgi:hypothetical protein